MDLKQYGPYPFPNTPLQAQIFNPVRRTFLSSSFDSYNSEIDRRQLNFVKNTVRQSWFVAELLSLAHELAPGLMVARHKRWTVECTLTLA